MTEAEIRDPEEGFVVLTVNLFPLLFVGTC
jgi:hypothetical protein